MKLEEYEKVKDYKYFEYCGYLQSKYGIGEGYYMTKSGYNNPKCKRTKDGLVTHHIYEMYSVMLSTPKYAFECPYEWQKAENLAFCDYLEHLFLHVLICEEAPLPTKENPVLVGFGGVVNFLVPELNDFYSGFESTLDWKRRCWNQVKDDKDVYLTLVKRFKPLLTEKYASCPLIFPPIKPKILYSSFNERWHLWTKEKNQEIFEEIKNL